MRSLLSLFALLGALGVTPARAQASLEDGEPCLPHAEASRASPHDDNRSTSHAKASLTGSPLGIALAAGTGASFGAALYAVGAGLGLPPLLTEDAPEAAFFAVVLAAPLLPAAGALLATLLFRPASAALRVSAASIGGGGIGLVLGGVLFFLIGPMLAEPDVFFLATLFGAPLLGSVVGAAAGAPLLAPPPEE